MRRLALLLFTPAVLAAQEQVQQAGNPAVAQWQGEQRALGARAESDLNKRREQSEKAIVDLDRRQREVFMAGAEIFGTADPDGTDARFLKQVAEERRNRVTLELASAAALDSLRRTGDAAQILSALQLRRAAAERFAKDSDALLVIAKDLLKRANKAEDFYKSEDNPSKPADRRAFVKDMIDHTARLVRLSRALVNFETRRSEALWKETEDLDKQIESARRAGIAP